MLCELLMAVCGCDVLGATFETMQKLYLEKKPVMAAVRGRVHRDIREMKCGEENGLKRLLQLKRAVGELEVTMLREVGSLWPSCLTSLSRKKAEKVPVSTRKEIMLCEGNPLKGPDSHWKAEI